MEKLINSYIKKLTNYLNIQILKMLIYLTSFFSKVVKTTFKETIKIRKVVSIKKTRYMFIACTFISFMLMLYIHINIKYTWFSLFIYFIIKSFLIEIKASFGLKNSANKINKLNIKYKNLLIKFDNKFRIIESSNKKIVLFSSELTQADIEKKKQVLELFFNRKISSISRQKNDLRMINIYFEASTSFKRYYRFDEYINFSNIEIVNKMELPMLLGIDQNNKFFWGDLAKIKYLFVAGEAGGGKSVILNCIIQSLMVFAKSTIYILIDLKEGVEFSDYDKFTNCLMCSTREEFSKILLVLNDIMIKRLKLIRETEACKNIKSYNSKEHTKNMNNIIFVIDEMAEIKLGNKKPGISDDELLLTRILQKGRAAGIYGIGATQRPATDQIDSNVRAGYHKSISFAVSRTETQRMVKIMGTKHLKTAEFKTDINNEDNIIYKSFLILDEDDKYNKLPECNGVYKSLRLKLEKNRELITTVPKKIKEPNTFVDKCKHKLLTKVNKGYDNKLCPLVNYDLLIKSVEDNVISEIEEIKIDLGISKIYEESTNLLHGDNKNENYEKLIKYISENYNENGSIPGPAETKKNTGLTTKQRTGLLMKACEDGYIIKSGQTRYKINTEKKIKNY